MKAVLFERPGEPFAIADLELQPLASRQVRIEVGASGVCHTDHNLQLGYFWPRGPIVAGHEGAGTVVEVGPDVSLVQPGDRVVAVFTTACGTCWQCVRGRAQICERAGALRAPSAGRLDGSDVPAMGGLGTMAEFMTVHELQAIPVRSELPFEQLALVGCGVTTGAGAALFAAGVIPGSTVAVVGCGGVGMSAIQGARAAGAAMIIAVDPVADKREAAKAFGATHGVDPTTAEALEQVRALTDGRGVEYSLEVAGRVEAMTFAYDAACRGGTVVFVGAQAPGSELTLPANELHASAKQIIGCAYGSAQLRRDVPRLVALAESGALNLDIMISERLGLDDINTAIDIMARGDVIRSVLIP